jgi:hypothetical protein
MWRILVGLEMEGVMVEITILLNVDLTGRIVILSTPCIPTAMWRILTGLEMEYVMMELTILLSADLTVVIVLLFLTTRAVVRIILVGLEMDIVMIELTTL